MAITHEESLLQFHKQIEFVISTYSPHKITAADYNNVVIGGLGGSGIGGRLARLFFLQHGPIPIEVFSEYTLPAYCNEKTLVILCSYSGNTEETLSMYSQAKSLNCKIICVAAGGKLKELATSDSIPYYEIETGFQPRMTLGYGFSTLVMILGEFIGKSFDNELIAIASKLKTPENWKKKGEELFQFFEQTINWKFVTVCDLNFEAVAIRFCQQIQENAKGEGFVSVLPEANHNMIESYYSSHQTNFILLNSHTNKRVTARFEFLKRLLAEKGNKVFEYNTENSGFGLTQIFEVIYATDWLSILASNAKSEDNMQVGIITELKKYLDGINIESTGN